MTKTWASRVVALAILTVTSEGLASPEQTNQPAHRGTWADEKALVVDDISGFAEQGQWAFSTDAALAVERRTQVETSATTTTVSIYPAADYFLVKNLSIGGGAGIGYVRTADFRALTSRPARASATTSSSASSSRCGRSWACSTRTRT